VSDKRQPAAVTLADVARRAGVSAATVSRVLNGNYPVAGRTRDRVLRAVSELDYVVNAHARSLAGRTSDMVGVLVNNVADPFFGLIAAGVQAEVSAAQLLTVIAGTGGEPDEELRYVELLMRQRAEAIVIAGGQTGGAEHAERLAALVRRAVAAGTRVVLCGRPALAGAPSVEIDNRRGAADLTRHLLAFGHRRIAYLTGPAGNTTTEARLAGHRDALAAAGVPESPLREGTFDREGGRRAAAAILALPDRPTAIVAANDLAAAGVLAAAREAGLTVPVDVSVAGFDDLPISRDAMPTLTTVRVPLDELGRRAGRIAVGQLPAEPGQLVPELIARDSVCAPAPR
jgi:LacI family transcriptional regulator, galactose operon repressor